MRERAELFYPAPRRALPRLDRHHGGRVEAGRGGAHRARRPHEGARQPGEELARPGGRHPPRPHPGEEDGRRAGDPRLGGAAAGAEGGRGRPRRAGAPDRRAAADLGARFPAEPGEVRPQAARSGPHPGALGRREGEAGPGARAGLQGAQPRAARRAAGARSEAPRSADRGRPARRLLARFAAPARREPGAGGRELPRAAPATRRRSAARVDDLLRPHQGHRPRRAQADVRRERGAAPRPPRPAARPRLRPRPRAARPQGAGRPLPGRGVAPAPALAARRDRPRRPAGGPGRQRHPARRLRPRRRATARATACWMRPQTTVAGVVEKNTGAEPFDAPPELLAAAPQAAGEPLGGSRS